MIPLPNTLGEMRSKAEARIASLRRQAGLALVDQKTLPKDLHDDIAESERDLVAVEEAETEIVRRQREAEAATEAARLKALREILAQEETNRVDAVARAQMAANHLMSSLRDALDASDRMQKTFKHLGKPPPIALATFRDRLSGLLSGSLASAGSHPSRFGQITLHQLPNTIDWRKAPDRDWREFEQKQLAADMADATQPKGN